MRHKNDAISVDACVNELKESESFLYSKSQDRSSEYPGVRDEDFILIIMTPGQKELLLRFGNDCVCMDGTHGLNEYGFELHPLLVLDELREGYPGAFLISNKCDGTVIEIFYSFIQQAIGQLKPKTFMSDMTEAYYTAWINIIQPPEFR
ncbi:hypothetical protein HUJ04_001443 [Dendroctonus ponderosae]|nr:hypothetical protein HUJ04_001443 [Dendroctonus ponderosae]